MTTSHPKRMELSSWPRRGTTRAAAPADPDSARSSLYRPSFDLVIIISRRHYSPPGFQIRQAPFPILRATCLFACNSSVMASACQAYLSPQHISSARDTGFQAGWNTKAGQHRGGTHLSRGTCPHYTRSSSMSTTSFAAGSSSPVGEVVGRTSQRPPTSSR